MLNLAEMDPMQRQIFTSVQRATLRRDRRRGGLALLVSACWVVVVVMIVALLAGCAAPTPWGYGRDQAGNVFTEDCLQDLSWVQVPVLRVPRKFLDTLYARQIGPGETLNGHYTEDSGAGQIFIADDMHGWRYEDTLHHERCHAIAGEWHK